MGILSKTRKTQLSIVKQFLPKFSKKTRTYWDFDEKFQKFAGRLRVKGAQNGAQKWSESQAVFFFF